MTDLGSSVKTYATAFKKMPAFGEQLITDLHQAMDEKPTASEVAIACSLAMGLEIIAKPDKNVSKQVADYFKYSSTVLHVAKKDLPKKYAEKLDQMAKDVLVSTHSFSKYCFCWC